MYRIAQARLGVETARRAGDRQEELRATSLLNQLIAEEFSAQTKADR